MAQESAKGSRRNVSAVAMRGIEVTQSIENELRAIGVQVVNFWGTSARDTIIPIYARELEALKFVRDDASDRLRQAIDGTAEDASRLVISLHPAIRNWTVRVERWHAGKWTDGVRRATGLDVAFLISNLSAEAEVTAFQEWASGLIRNVGDDVQRRIETAIFMNLAANAPRRKLANEIADAMRIGRARARFIARDQANKLSGKLDELRHREAGINQYRWETARDERVRDTHRRNQGKVFKWSKPPRVTGHPRTEPNCRCTAQPYIPLLGSGSL